MWKEKIKHRKGKKKKKREKKMHTEGGENKNRHLIFLLSIGDKQEILKITTNTINCLMKHNNLSC